MSSVASPPVCARCGGALAPDDLACPSCGLFVQLPRLMALSERAQWLESHDPEAAAQTWRQCLELVPPDSAQAQLLQHRLDALEGSERHEAPRGDWAGAIARTGGSILISILVYSYFLGGPVFATGFVLLILVHEMGHVIALRYYGIKSSPPIFLPFVGAIISVASLKNAKEEAIVGIGGPVLGTVGALGCFALARHFHSDLLLQLSFWGFAINMLNLLPIPPLDGGRITAAVSPWIWPLGFLGLIGMLVAQYVQAGYSLAGVSWIFVLVLFYGAPRLWRTFRHRERTAVYYRISRAASWCIGISYCLLAAGLVTMFYWTEALGGGM